MRALVKVIIVLIVLAVILQIAGGLLNVFHEGSYETYIGSYRMVVTSEHFWWDSLFLLQLAIIAAMIAFIRK